MGLSTLALFGWWREMAVALSAARCYGCTIGLRLRSLDLPFQQAETTV